MAVIEDKIARQHRQQSMKREQMESKMNALRQEHLAVSHERAAIKAKLDEQEAVIQKLETRVKEKSSWVRANKYLSDQRRQAST